MLPAERANSTEIDEFTKEIEQLQTTVEQMRDDINIKGAEIDQLKSEKEDITVLLVSSITLIASCTYISGFGQCLRMYLVYTNGHCHK